MSYCVSMEDVLPIATNKIQLFNRNSNPSERQRERKNELLFSFGMGWEVNVGGASDISRSPIRQLSEPTSATTSILAQWAHITLIHHLTLILTKMASDFFFSFIIFWNFIFINVFRVIKILNNFLKI